MKIPTIKNIIISGGVYTMLAGTLCSTTNVKAQNTQKADTYESTTIPAHGTKERNILFNAPNPDVMIMGKHKKATIVVDITNNILYKYDKTGNPQSAYLIASGKKSTPTHTGVRVVSHVESYPYRKAPISSKRRKNPRDYGPRIICLNIINTKTGELSSTGEFIHGNNNPNSIGKHVSHGCMRMDNSVIKELSTQVKRGDIVVIQE
jgi:lipoprotein-anchoring transpeptidase ErfK/SrfK